MHMLTCLCYGICVLICYFAITSALKKRLACMLLLFLTIIYFYAVYMIYIGQRLTRASAVFVVLTWRADFK
jgi:hypothetical protein